MSGMDAIIEKYIKLRDGKAQLVQKHKEKIQGIDSVLARIEAYKRREIAEAKLRLPLAKLEKQG